MVDKISSAVAAKVYENISNGPAALSKANTENNSFGDVLKTMAQETIGTMRAGEAASAKAISGDASLPEVVQAITASEVTLQTVVAVRDRLIGAYQEIMRMPV
ncbi:MAG: flagellar hook-basal body complex protein FliE [Pseudomonadota bacterium]